MLHKSFHCENELLSGHDTFAEAYADYLLTQDIPSCLEDDIHPYHLQQAEHQQEEYMEVDSGDSHADSRTSTVHTEDWMLLSQLFPDLGTNKEGGSQVDWCAAANSYPNLRESSFIPRSFDTTSTQTSSADPLKL